ncbi:MAG: GAF domain-containing protein [Chloroflexota bacterium]
MATHNSIFTLPTDRKARSASYTVILMVVIQLWSIISLLGPFTRGAQLELLTIVEIIVMVGQVATAISAQTLISRGNTEMGVMRLSHSFAVTSIFRVLVRASIGVPLGLITALVLSGIGYLALPPQRGGQNALVGYGVGSLIVLADVFITAFYGRLESSEVVVGSMRIMAALVLILQIAALQSQARRISIASRISNIFTLLTVITIFIVAAASIQVWDQHTADEGNAQAELAVLETLERRITLIGALIAFGGAALGVMFARTLTNPLRQLAGVTAELRAGKLDARATFQGGDEVNQLAESFNSMAESLNGLFGQLEVRVDERTQDLRRRALELQSAAEIGRAATNLRDLESLMERTVHLITERFGFYHAGIFLVDSPGEYAVLQAASSEGGRRMVQQGHRLKIGETGIVGFVTHAGKARIALDVGKDAVFFDNPHLPHTHSEMAVPLIAGGQILGALDVQSTETGAFDEEDITTLQILADQVAIAIQNARLFKEAQSALEAARIAYGEISRDAWSKIIREQARISYVAAGPGVIQPNTASPTADVVRTVETGDVILSNDGHTIGVPIKIRGHSIGALRLRKQDSSSGWSHDEITLAIALSEQLSGALESARLYKESQQRAARESLVSDISARITAQPRVDTILREAVQELGQTFGNAAVTFQLVEMSDERSQARDAGNGSGPLPPSNGKGEG